MEIREKQRVRLNVSRTSKGAYSWDATLELSDERDEIPMDLTKGTRDHLQAEMDAWRKELDAMFPPTP